jgi:hypothetical protein
MRTGLVQPLHLPAQKALEKSSVEDTLVEAGETDDDGDGDVVLAPPIERPPSEPLSAGMYCERSDAAKINDEPATVARNVSLGSLMLGTLLIAACLGLSRASMSAGIVAFLVLVPAYIRTLSAIYYYRQRQRELGGHDLAAIFATSFVLSLMGLSAGGLVFLVTTIVVGLVAGLAGWEDPGEVTMFLGAAAAFVTVLVLVHRVWPVNED